MIRKGGVLLILIVCLLCFRLDVVMSGSMEPAIPTGSLVISSRIVKSSYEVGDIIIYRDDQQNILHRIVSIEEDYITKGDANENEDFLPVSYEQIVGHYLFHIPYLGYLWKMIQEHVLFILMLIFIKEGITKWKKRKYLQEH